MLSRVFRVGTTLIVLGLMAASAGAQGPGGGGGGRGPGGGRTFTMGPRGTAAELMGLLATPEIRKEVKLSDEGFAAVDKLLKENEAARGGGRGPGGGGPGGPGGGGPGGPGGGGPGGGFDADRMKEIQERMAEAQKKTDEAVLGALSDDQKKALETLKGAKFEFPESLRSPFAMMRGGFGGFGGGGFGGGRPGGGDQTDADREKARAEREQRAKEANQKAQEVLDDVLPPEGMDRLIGLYVQLRGNTSITGEMPSKKLGLSEADIKKIDEAVGKVRAEMMQGFGGGGGRGNRPGGGRPNSESGT